jgi:hypothetical protein
MRRVGLGVRIRMEQHEYTTLRQNSFETIGEEEGGGAAAIHTGTRHDAGNHQNYFYGIQMPEVVSNLRI